MNKEKKYPQFLETAQIVSMEQPVMHLPLLETEEVTVTSPGEAYPQINVLPKSQIVKAESYQAYARLRVDQMREMELFGINAKDEMKSVLQNEMLQMILKSLYEKYHKLGLVQREGDLSKWKKWLTSVFGIQHITHIKEEKLGVLLLKLSHRIAASSRLGKGNFVVMSPKMTAILADDPKLEFVSMTGVILSPGSPRLVGTYCGLQVYDNVFMDDETIVCGRQPQMGQPGVYFFDHLTDFLEKEDIGPDGVFARICLRSLHAIEEIGRAETMYYTEKVSFKKRPLWKKILSI